MVYIRNAWGRNSSQTQPEHQTTTIHAAATVSNGPQRPISYTSTFLCGSRRCLLELPLGKFAKPSSLNTFGLTTNLIPPFRHICRFPVLRQNVEPQTFEQLPEDKLIFQALLHFSKPSLAAPKSCWCSWSSRTSVLKPPQQ